MDWIRLKLAEALSGKQPVNKKLLLLVAGVVAATVFLINSVTATKSDSAVVESASPEAAVVINSAKIFIHVVGEVNEPGIYELDSGSRLMDAVFSAGGLTKIADESSVNLARELTDGEQVVIYKKGESPQSPVGSSVAGAQISLNRATQAELEELPGVGPALAGRMIDWRTANGGFKKKEDLLGISGIGDKLFAGIKDRVIL